jgi:hypothetical protein
MPIQDVSKSLTRSVPRDALAAKANILGRKLGMNTRRTVGTVRSSVRHTDLRDQCSVSLCPPLRPRVVAARGDTQQPAHMGRVPGVGAVVSGLP